MHFESECARHSNFSRPIECLTFAGTLMLDICVADVSRNAIGDSLTAESKELTKRQYTSRPNVGNIPAKTGGFHHEDTLNSAFGRTMLIVNRGLAIEQKAGQ
jgi:hypothetical protein